MSRYIEAAHYAAAWRLVSPGILSAKTVGVSRARNAGRPGVREYSASGLREVIARCEADLMFVRRSASNGRHSRGVILQFTRRLHGARRELAALTDFGPTNQG